MREIIVSGLILILMSGCAGVNHQHSQYVTHQRAINTAQEVYANNWQNQTRLEVIAIAEGAADDAVQASKAQTIQDLKDLSTLQSPVTFEKGSAFLSGLARLQLDRKAAILHARPNVGLIIIGRASISGSISKNLVLSTRRATIAREFLISKGIDPDRMRTVPRGEADSSMEHVLDRVVEFKAIYLKESGQSRVVIQALEER